MMANFLRGLSTGPASYYQIQRKYTISTAFMGAIGFVVGLGDRHVGNILIDQTTGELMHVDFALLFNSGEKLNIPEVSLNSFYCDLFFRKFLSAWLAMLLMALVQLASKDDSVSHLSERWTSCSKKRLPLWHAFEAFCMILWLNGKPRTRKIMMERVSMEKLNWSRVAWMDTLILRFIRKLDHSLYEDWSQSKSNWPWMKRSWAKCSLDGPHIVRKSCLISDISCINLGVEDYKGINKFIYFRGFCNSFQAIYYGISELERNCTLL